MSRDELCVLGILVWANDDWDISDVPGALVFATDIEQERFVELTGKVAVGIFTLFEPIELPPRWP
ncbi:hypothetical protein [Halorubrum sp. Atlit-26R]|uniref:hypothetical protein n=1 Tax=Halorubrum sp. Atlit-26R TaxID=2282128 RepID=UPI001F491BB0|nr:hypothetical protein [Halorubrum sp. Atlit-26R]